MYRIRPILLTLFAVFLSVGLVAAQDNCPVIVRDALAAVDTACAATDRNQACYGNIQITATPNIGSTLTFDQVGDIDDVTDISLLRLSPFDEASAAWGVAVLKLQANLPDTLPGAAVTMLLFGDVTLQSDSPSMDAFYFRSGIGRPDCVDAPDGIMIQTPEGLGQVTLTANDVTISLGSSAFLTAEAGEEMTIALLEGTGSVTANGQTVPLTGGEFTWVQMSLNLRADGVPRPPEPITNLQLPNLPTETLNALSNAESDEDAEPDEDEDEDAEPDEEESSNTSGSSSTSGAIVPLDGTWRFDLTTTSSSGCPAQLTSLVASNIERTGTVNFGGAFDIVSLLEASGEPLPPGVQISQPDPNTYNLSYSEDGGTVDYNLQLVSASQIQGRMVINVAADGLTTCAITFEFTVNHQG